ncbi:hypothetical protein ANO11243_076410 [Dothideomycetidae sp. 11243]|nr:hypothetical protein ANO11243_076410 [fungal sp. No.11243]
MTTPSSPTARRWILTIGVAVITVAGAYLGANLKTDQDLKRERRAVVESSALEQLKILETQKAKLVSQRTELERKLAEIMQRQRKNAGGGSG